MNNYRTKNKSFNLYMWASDYSLRSDVKKLCMCLFKLGKRRNEGNCDLLRMKYAATATMTATGMMRRAIKPYNPERKEERFVHWASKITSIHFSTTSHLSYKNKTS